MKRGTLHPGQSDTPCPAGASAAPACSRETLKQVEEVGARTHEAAIPSTGKANIATMDDSESLTRCPSMRLL